MCKLDRTYQVEKVGVERSSNAFFIHSQTYSLLLGKLNLYISLITLYVISLQTLSFFKGKLFLLKNIFHLQAFN